MNQHSITIREFLSPAPPLAELLRLAVPYTDSGTLAEARRLSTEELRLYLAYAEREQSIGTMRKSLQGLLSSPPPLPRGGSHEQNRSMAESRREWEEDLDEAYCQLIEEERCFDAPLEDEWGERLEPHKNLLTWLSCPGGPYEFEDMRYREGWD